MKPSTIAMLKAYARELARNRAPEPVPRLPWHVSESAVIIEALRLMRETTNSRAQHDRAVAALKTMGVDHE